MSSFESVIRPDVSSLVPVSAAGVLGVVTAGVVPVPPPNNPFIVSTNP